MPPAPKSTKPTKSTRFLEQPIELNPETGLSIEAIAAKRPEVSNTAAVEVCDVVYSYGKKKKLVKALRGINLTVPEGGMCVTFHIYFTSFLNTLSF